MWTLWNLFKPWHLDKLFKFSETSDPSKRMILGADLMHWLVGTFIFSLFFYFYHTEPIFKLSCMVAATVSLGLMVLVSSGMSCMVGCG